MFRCVDGCMVLPMPVGHKLANAPSQFFLSVCLSLRRQLCSPPSSNLAWRAATPHMLAHILLPT